MSTAKIDYFPTLVIWIADICLLGKWTAWYMNVTLSQLKDIIKKSLVAIILDDWEHYWLHVQNNDKQQKN